MRKLSPLPVRTDHTDRECSVFLYGIIAGLCSIANVHEVRNAFRYWASSESQDEWDAIERTLKPDPPPLSPAPAKRKKAKR